MSYATKTDLSAYTGIPETELPADSARLIKRASELIDMATLNRIDTTDTEHAEAAKNASCAQVEYWLQAGEHQDVTGPIQGYSIGSFQVQFGAGDNRISPTELAPRAKRYLFLSGLMYRGVGMK